MHVWRGYITTNVPNEWHKERSTAIRRPMVKRVVKRIQVVVQYRRIPHGVVAANGLRENGSQRGLTGAQGPR